MRLAVGFGRVALRRNAPQPSRASLRANESAAFRPLSPIPYYRPRRTMLSAEARPISGTTKSLASRLPSGSISPKITKEISQGATREHRTLPLPNIARCNTTTSIRLKFALQSDAFPRVNRIGICACIRWTGKALFRRQNRPLLPTLNASRADSNRPYPTSRKLSAVPMIPNL